MRSLKEGAVGGQQHETQHTWKEGWPPSKLEEVSIPRKRLVNTFPQQPEHTPASTTPVPILGNSPINKSLSDEGILGSGVFYAVHSKAIQKGPTGQASELQLGVDSVSQM
jgi:hypothetical protein